VIRILLVDDAPDVRTLIRTKLRLTKRFDVVGEAGTGREALLLAQDLQPDLVLLDVSMPDVDGLDALAQLPARAPAARIVMFSGFEEHGLADRALALGAVDFIEKSTPIDDLVDRLLDAMGEEPARAGDAAPASTEPEPVLQDHLERFRAAFDQAAIGMATMTLTGQIVRANPSLESLVGEGSLVGRHYETCTAPSALEALGRAIATAASGDVDLVSHEHPVGDRDVVSTLAVVRDSERRPLYLFLQVQDVTERRAAEEQLRRSEERFRLLVASVQDYAIFMLDPDGNVASWNAGAARIKGYAADEIIGRHFSTFYLPDAVAAGHPAYELRVAIAEGRYEEEGWRKRKDGTTFWANVVITAVRDAGGELLGFAKVTRDMTERKRLLEELEREAAERIQLLAVTAHELRSPVSVVRGFVSTLDKHWQELEEQERRDMISSLARSGERLAHLVEDLFTAARLETGAITVKTRDVDAEVVLAEVARDLGEDVVTVDAQPTRVRADRGRLHQMVANYVTNALRYGEPPIVVALRVVDGAAEISVTDHGPGVDDEVAPRLFAKFVTGGSKEGSGLGLFIVRELARAQGGDAWYEPASAGGARFVLRLPLAD
jgi:PAS domain S-box-containing protein